jgi:hypothetical protein
LSTTQAAKKAVKLFQKVVKNGAAAIARPFKKHCISLGSGASAAGDSSAHLLFPCLPNPADKHIIVGGSKSTRQTSVINSDEEDNPQPVETPKQELSTFWSPFFPVGKKCAQSESVSSNESV